MLTPSKIYAVKTGHPQFYPAKIRLNRYREVKM
jgi:hypothetical protein